MNGYTSAEYAAALTDLGRPIALPNCGGWLLKRAIPGTESCDAVGCYPLFRCAHWGQLGNDLLALPKRLITVSLVPDPFGDPPADLAACFPDVCVPFKEHFGVDFSREWRRSISRHHRRNVRVGARTVEIERCEDPGACLGTWTDLYGQLTRRHRISGPARFSSESFQLQLRVPGIVVFRAAADGESVAMSLWYVDGDVAYYHLGACDARGYEQAAMFAMFDVALSHFAAAGARWAQLGGAAGYQQLASNGLSRFKAGWANERRTAWFCGRVLDPEAYGRLMAGRKPLPTGFFPGYRQPEAA
jgi:Acetyltransferase (GNAT) domain